MKVTDYNNGQLVKVLSDCYANNNKFRKGSLLFLHKDLNYPNGADLYPQGNSARPEHCSKTGSLFFAIQEFRALEQKDFATPKKAALILDALVPDWYKKINLDKFNIKFSQRCILGQLFGDYTNGNRFMIENTGISTVDIRSAFVEDYGLFSDEEVVGMQAKWVKQINKRLEKDNE